MADLEIPETSRTDAKFPILEEPTEVILEELRKVDPIMADRWHPGDRRKIQRSLEIYLKTGKPASQVYEEQRLQKDLSPDSSNPDTPPAGSGPSLRFPTLVLWVHAPKSVLYPRLDSRIEKMLDRGLLSEVQTLTDFRLSYEERTGDTIDQTRGIWVSIGYKEFLDYQAALSNDTLSETEMAKIKTAAIEKTQAATRQYANRQIRWIRIKLLNALFGAGMEDRTFLLDGSDLSQWDENVIQPSREITEKFLLRNVLPTPSEMSGLAGEMLVPKREYDLAQRRDLWERRVCETCGTVAVTENDWMLHVKSRGHRRAVGEKKKRENVREVRAKDIKALQSDVVDILETYQGIREEEDELK